VKLEVPDVIGGWQALAEYQYDGQSWLIVKISSTIAQPETYDYYLTKHWQKIGEHRESAMSNANADVHFIWGEKYIDELILRERGANEEPLYVMQDGNWNIVRVEGILTENTSRFAYESYGMSQSLSDDYMPAPDPLWENRFSGYCFDLNELASVRMRYYVPAIGTWASRDPLASKSNERDQNTASIRVDEPIREHLGRNLFRYADGRPLTNTDPSGMFLPLLYAYGNWCGAFKAGPGAPIDALDAACQRHDTCLATVAEFLIPCRRRWCDKTLANEASLAAVSGCTTWACTRNALLVGYYMSQGGEYLPIIGPPHIGGTIPGAPWPF
jgi:RHS repeat-associated protein